MQHGISKLHFKYAILTLKTCTFNRNLYIIHIMYFLRTACPVWKISSPTHFQGFNHHCSAIPPTKLRLRAVQHFAGLILSASAARLLTSPKVPRSCNDVQVVSIHNTAAYSRRSQTVVAYVLFNWW